jgi:hypothetical protein
MPLGQAELFMLSLSEIDCLLERLRLWLFMLDYPNMETDVSESLNELKNAMNEVEESQTFRQVMGILLTIGNALNGTDLKAFQLDSLSKFGEVKGEFFVFRILIGLEVIFKNSVTYRPRPQIPSYTSCCRVDDQQTARFN